MCSSDLLVRVRDSQTCRKLSAIPGQWDEFKSSVAAKFQGGEDKDLICCLNDGRTILLKIESDYNTFVKYLEAARTNNHPLPEVHLTPTPQNPTHTNPNPHTHTSSRSSTDNDDMHDT